MINFPLFERLDVSGYGMFPGKKGGQSGLHLDFNEGLTLVLGANGLGKTTLITIIYRCLTGPYDIPALNSSGDLGTKRLEHRALPRSKKNMLSRRVSDRAKDATATLYLRMGNSKIVIERSLADLSLIKFEIEGKEIKPNEDKYHEEITTLAGTWSFGDWLLIIHYLIFYFEDRRALVWDATAQRQLLRALFLSPKEAKKWTNDERTILELDSEVRNLGNVMRKEKYEYDVNDGKTKNVKGTKTELKTLYGLQEEDQRKQETLLEDLEDRDRMRIEARQTVLQNEDDYESTMREYEHAKLLALQMRFPSNEDTMRYILGYLLSTTECLVCGNKVPNFAEELESRIVGKQCVVCASNVGGNESKVNTEFYDRKANKQKIILEKKLENLEASKQEFQSIENSYDTISSEVSRINQIINNRAKKIDRLIDRLPPEDSELIKQRNDLRILKNRYDRKKLELDSYRKVFAIDLDKWNRKLVKQSDQVEKAFANFANKFLTEDCRLRWELKESLLGQTGERIPFPAYILELTGTDFPNAVRREGPEHVSESQREFIDLSFRIALMQVAGSSGSSLIIDAPEASLDAVFVGRAADVFGNFTETALGNKLMLTSNLVDGELIPKLLETVPNKIRRKSIFNLFEVSTPTAAVQQYRSEYDAHLEKIFELPGVK